MTVKQMRASLTLAVVGFSVALAAHAMDSTVTTFLHEICSKARSTYFPARGYTWCKCSAAFDLDSNGEISRIVVIKEPVNQRGKTNPIATAALKTAVRNLAPVSKTPAILSYPVHVVLVFQGAKDRPITCTGTIGQGAASEK